jgi:hypothetical protein
MIIMMLVMMAIISSDRLSIITLRNCFRRRF